MPHKGKMPYKKSSKPGHKKRKTKAKTTKRRK